MVRRTVCRVFCSGGKLITAQLVMHQLNSILCGPPEIRPIPQKFHLSVCLSVVLVKGGKKRCLRGGGLGGGSAPPLLRLGPPLLESEPSLKAWRIELISRAGITIKQSVSDTVLTELLA